MDVIVKRSYYLFFLFVSSLMIFATSSESKEIVGLRASLADIMESRGIRELYLNDMLRETSEIINQRLSPTDLSEQINDSLEKWDDYFVPGVPRFNSTPFETLAEALLEADLQLYIWILVKSEILNQVWNHQVYPQIKLQIDGEREQYSRSISKENLLHPDEKVTKLENKVKSQIYRSKVLSNYFNFWSQFIVEIYSKIGTAKWEQASSKLQKLIGNDIKILVKNEVAYNFNLLYSFSSSLNSEKFQESIEMSAYYFVSVYHLVSWLVKFSPEYKKNVFLTQSFLQESIDESDANQLLEKLRLHMQDASDTSFSGQLKFIRTVLN